MNRPVRILLSVLFGGVAGAAGLLLGLLAAERIQRLAGSAGATGNTPSLIAAAGWATGVVFAIVAVAAAWWALKPHPASQPPQDRPPA